ncbi:hypothetical protein PAAG_02237 [Paracoccidioides lutzii Pb01]|uniref:Uncharacterized protein n=1 Tax=Paracoccidioides lutzii (strain ATCC MYA-826 / Pb01) TaxID=502779 RepID=C1GVG0_PARBA|nr:hypothetical protein PAAG_02237 [Paracoccidioides lutzii Pb01]EEH40182.2 hypothetical protein PAAG_02237 [Paracoccidioides lutzii Pb01]
MVVFVKQLSEENDAIIIELDILVTVFTASYEAFLRPGDSQHSHVVHVYTVTVPHRKMNVSARPAFTSIAAAESAAESAAELHFALSS